MELIKIQLSKIKPYDKNPRKNDGAVEAVMESIKQCSYVSPIIVDEDMVILAGHTRFKALKKLGRTECEVIIKSGLTEEQKRKYRILDNKTNELAIWDDDLLSEELLGLDFEGFDFGFDIKADDSSEIIEDEAPEVDEDAEPIAKLGDIWQLGRHRLMCGDSTDKATVELLMDGKKADMVFTDPPYGMNLDTDYSSMKNNLDFAKSKNFTGGKKYEQGKVDDFNPSMIDAVLSIEAKEMFLWGGRLLC